MKLSQFPNNYLQRKQEDQYLVQNAILNLTSLHAVAVSNKRFDALFLPISGAPNEDIVQNHLTQHC